nr:spermatogenesis-associated protein 25 [Pogona vitticeps]
MRKALAGLSPLSHRGESSSRETQMAPGSLPRLCPGTPPSARTSTPRGLLRWKPQAKQAAPLQLRDTQLLQEPDPTEPSGGVCQSPSPPAGKGISTMWEPLRGLYATSLPQEHPARQTGNRWLGPSSVPPLPLSQQPKDMASSSGDFGMARWGFLPSALFSRPAKLSKDRGAPSVLHLPSNVCILTLAMMIAGIPTVPVPGIREEDMIQAARCFMTENLESGGMEGSQRRRWAVLPHLGPSCKRDRQRKRAAGKSLLPLLLAQLEK